MSNGAFWFGVVIGFITYRTLRHKTSSGISDIAAVIGAVGGAAVLKLFPVGTDQFDNYARQLRWRFGGWVLRVPDPVDHHLLDFRQGR
jgi:hypothetical protein